MSALSKRVDKLSPATNQNEHNKTIVFLNPGETHDQAISRSGLEGSNLEQCMFIEFVAATTGSYQHDHP